MVPDALSIPRCYVDRDMSEAELVSLAGGTAAVFSARCPTKTTPNEDSAALIPFDEHSGVLVVADGMGGGVAGEVASRLAIEAMEEAVTHAVRDGHRIRTAVLNGFEQANHRVQALSGGAATTLAVVEIDRRSMRPYHAGDSAIVVIGGRGKVKLQTVAHSPVGYAVEAGVLDRVDAMQHADRHLVSNVVGMPAMRIEIGPTLPLAARDTVLLASDGLHDNLHDDEICELMRKGPLDQVAQRIIQEAKTRMATSGTESPCKPDDLTFILFRPGAAS